ncbi:MAG: 2-amino-4-hydroxy-6-hydroxymethyldihydropteridine diphosphokinase [Bacteroidales bacterium]|nr:2-amino-4-hydroxy-6-hydroxymethyldihydropteridine diphosphokinase [Bacteroidales bacterium]
MNNVILSLGSNSHDSNEQMRRCIHWLQNTLQVTAKSTVYRTAATNGKDTDYTNAVVAVCTPMPIDQLNGLMKQYERECGRTPQSKSLGSIPIDIDVVIFNNQVIRPKDFAQPYFTIGYQQLL